MRLTVTSGPLCVGYPRFLSVDTEKIPNEGERSWPRWETTTSDCPSPPPEPGESGDNRYTRRYQSQSLVRKRESNHIGQENARNKAAVRLIYRSFPPWPSGNDTNEVRLVRGSFNDTTVLTLLLIRTPRKCGVRGSMDGKILSYHTSSEPGKATTRSRIHIYSDRQTCCHLRPCLCDLSVPVVVTFLLPPSSVCRSAIMFLAMVTHRAHTMLVHSAQRTSDQLRWSQRV